MLIFSYYVIISQKCVCFVSSHKTIIFNDNSETVIFPLYHFSQFRWGGHFQQQFILVVMEGQTETMQLFLEKT